MERILVKKTAGLKGCVKVQGGKNAVLPILAASILTKEKVRLNNCPDIDDVRHTIKLLKMLGCKVFFMNGTIDIYPADVADTRVSGEHTDKTRSSIVFLGAMIGRLKKTVITHPGGCKIGERPLDIHISSIRKLNVTIFEKYGDIIAYTDEIKGGDIKLSFPSVGATENIMLTAALATGTTIIKNPAREPEITELAEFINAMGGKITGAGTDTIIIDGVEELHGTEYNIGGDRIVAATYMGAVAVAGGKIKLTEVKPANMKAITDVYRKIGLKIKLREDSIECRRKKRKSRLKNIGYIETAPYPEFPTDVQPVISAVLSYGMGVSKVRENIFENRFMYANELMKMGADIIVKKENTAIIYGKEKLYGANVKAMDLRGGAALIIAALGAEGETCIEDVHFIKRGYENIVRDLQLLGADIREEVTGENEEEDGR